MSIKSSMKFTVLLLVQFLAATAPAVEPLATWHARTTSDITNNLNGVTYGAGLYVAVGLKGTIVRSLDGAQWSYSTSGVTANLNSVTYGDGLFVVTGANDTLLISTNGRDWVLKHVGPIGGSNVEWRGVAQGNGKLVAVGMKGASAWSTDGQVWTYADANTAPDGTVDDRLKTIGFGAGIFVAVGSGFDPYHGVIVTSPDGQQWTSRVSNTDGDWVYCVAYGNGMFVAAGENGCLTTSPTGTDWTPRSSGTSSHLWSIVHTPEGFVVVGDAGRIRVSTTGTSWAGKSSGTTKSLFGIAWGDHGCVAVGRDGTILQSDPFASTVVGPKLGSIIRNGSQVHLNFIGKSGQSYTVERSADLVHWSAVTTVVGSEGPTDCTLEGQTERICFYRLKE